jgi:hypothetical protein
LKKIESPGETKKENLPVAKDDSSSQVNHQQSILGLVQCTVMPKTAAWEKMNRKGTHLDFKIHSENPLALKVGIMLISHHAKCTHFPSA